MWQIVSNAASLATCAMLAFYLIGHIWKIKKIQYTLTENYRLEKDFDYNSPPLNNFIALTDGPGRVFSVDSPNGFEKITFFEAEYDCELNDSKKGKIIKVVENILPNEKVYAKIDIPDTREGCFIEIIKNDGINISFGIYSSGYDGSLIRTNYTLRMTAKSWIYYICS